MSLKSFHEQIDLHGWHDVPNRIISREGHLVDSSTDIWLLPIPIIRYSDINFSKILHLGIRWVGLPRIS
jgi:hypothetical protein